MINAVMPVNVSRPPRWMVVDQNDAVLSLLNHVVARYGDGLALACFQSPADAANAFAAEPAAYDFVLSDLEMSAAGDSELCRRLRAFTPSLQVFLRMAGQVLSDEEAAQKGFCELPRQRFPLAALQPALEPAILTYSHNRAGGDSGLRLVSAN